MTSWTKEKSLKELDILIGEIKKLREQRRFSTDHTHWVIRSLEFLEEVFGRNSRYYLTFASFQWVEMSSSVIGIQDIAECGTMQRAIDKRNHDAYLRQLESAKGLLQAASYHIKRAPNINSVYEGKDTGPESSAILKVLYIAEHKLRKVIRDRPKDEKEIQDAFENLLIGADIPYSRETERIKYSSTTYIPDFVMEKIDLAVDIKLCMRKGRESEIIREINDDILAYKTKFGNLFFVVYDLGFIRDIDRFKGALEENQNVVVRVIKH